MSQKTYPRIDITTAGWSKTPSGAASYSGTLWERSNPDDSNLVTSPNDPVGSVFETKLAKLDWPQQVSGGHKLRVRLRKTESGAMPTTVLLLQGGREIARRKPTLIDSLTTYEFVLADAEVAQITSYLDLRVRVIVGEPSFSIGECCCWSESSSAVVTISTVTCPPGTANCVNAFNRTWILTFIDPDTIGVYYQLGEICYSSGIDVHAVLRCSVTDDKVSLTFGMGPDTFAIYEFSLADWKCGDGVVNTMALPGGEQACSGWPETIDVTVYANSCGTVGSTCGTAVEIALKTFVHGEPITTAEEWWWKLSDLSAGDYRLAWGYSFASVTVTIYTGDCGSLAQLATSSVAGCVGFDLASDGDVWLKFHGASTDNSYQFQVSEGSCE